MELEQAERFVAAAERDYQGAVAWYCAMMEGRADGPEDVVQPRADVLAAQLVLELARSEARGAGRRGVEEEVACPNCGRMVGRAYLFDSAARGVEWCAGCDVGAAPEGER